MEIHLPDEIKHYEPELRYFIDSMVRKLHVNRHKGFAEDLDIYAALHQVRGEVDELSRAIKNESQFEVFMEAVDVANQAWLTGLVALRLTKEEFKKGRGDET